MERTKNPAGEEKIRWRKEGGGTLRIKGRIIKPNQVFEAYPEDIPQAFRDVVIPLDPIKEKKEEPIQVKGPEYKLVKREESNWYDVFDSQGKKVNEKALTQTKGLELIESLV